jgi:hypothetical protein
MDTDKHEFFAAEQTRIFMRKAGIIERRPSLTEGNRGDH